MGTDDRYDLTVTRDDLLRRHLYTYLRDVLAGSRVVQLGCEDASVAPLIAEEARSITVVDPDAESLAAVRRLDPSPRLLCVESDLAGFAGAISPTLADIVVCTALPGDASSRVGLVEALRSACHRGVAVLVVLDGADGPDVVASQLSGTIALQQWASEGSIIGAPQIREAESLTATFAEGGLPRHPDRVVVYTGDVPFPGLGDGRAIVNAVLQEPVRTRLAEELSHANAVLQAENARLGRRLLGHAQGPAAVSLQRVFPSLGSNDDDVHMLREAADFRRRFPYLFVTFGDGWGDEEVGPDDASFRWLDGRGFVSVGAVGVARPALLFRASARSFLRPRELSIQIDGVEVDRCEVAVDPATPIDVRLPEGEGPVDLVIAPVGPPDPAAIANPADGRLLSVSLSAWRIEPHW